MTSTIRKQPEPARPPTRRRHLISRALSGVLAAAVVLGVGELLAVLIAPAAAPFLAVGSSTVDRTPAWARDFAIQTFGTNDKPALFVGMALAIVAIAAAAGIAERTRGPIGSLILGMLGVVGVTAALARPGATWVYAVPTAIGTVAGIMVLRILTAAARDTIAPDDGAAYSRRRFLVLASTAAAVAAASVAGARYLGQQIAGALEDRLGFRIPGVAARDQAAVIGAGTDVGIPGVATFITPNAEFYRIDTALRVPQLTTAQWRLRIHGMVERELTLTWDDLTARTPIERVITLTCVSNEVGGNLAGNATWIGYPIAPLLAEVGVSPDADMLLSTSPDGFTAGTPLAVLRDGRDAMLAVGHERRTAAVRTRLPGAAGGARTVRLRVGDEVGGRLGGDAIRPRAGLLDQAWLGAAGADQNRLPHRGSSRPGAGRRRSGARRRYGVGPAPRNREGRGSGR